MKALSILQVLLGLIVTVSLTLQVLNGNVVAVIFGVIVLLQCVTIISIAEGSGQ